MDRPRRHRLLVLAAFAAALATGSVLVLIAFERLNDLRWLAGILVINAMGDLLAAAAAQVLAPTRIVLRPGETTLPVAEVISGFGQEARGRVRVQGELWRARVHPDSEPVAPGDRVQVISRDGLTLIVRRC